MDTSTILQILYNYAEGCDFQVHFNGYAEPGYTDPKSGLIVTGDWNPRSWDEPIPKEDLLMPRIGVILGKLGAELEWYDEWRACMGCGGLVRIQPNSYGWTPSYWAENGTGLYCQTCVLDAPEDYLGYLEDNPKAANTLALDLGEHGYVKIDKEYENGFYPGQSDDPKVIAESLRKQGIRRFVFDIDGVGQFDCAFSLWIHKSECPKLGSTEIESKGVDIAAAMQAALKHA